MKRLIGIILLLSGLAGVILGVVGCNVGGNVIDGVGAGLGDALTQVSNSLNTTKGSLEQTKGTLQEASTALSDAEIAVADASSAINDISEQVSVTTSENVVGTLGTVQDLIANSVLSSVEAAEGTLQLLTGVRPMLEAQGLSGDALGAMLGMESFSLDFLDYAPEISMLDSVDQLSTDLADISNQLQETESTLSTNLDTLSQDVMTISQDVNNIKGQVDGFVPLVDEYIGVVDNINAQIGQIQSGLSGGLGSARTAVTVLMIWLILGNLAPLYLGWELVSGNR